MSSQLLEPIQLQPKDGTKTPLGTFLRTWDADYEAIMNSIPLFNPTLTQFYSQEQQKMFARILYHLRGHFAELLFYMGNFAPTNSAKEMIMGNIRDEFGGHGISHEQLYMIFADTLGVDLRDELLDEKYYLGFAKKYIEGQMRWLRAHDWAHCLAAFAAIERLDNVDYVKLRGVAESFGLKGKSLTFFNVHISAEHFESIMDHDFVEVWNQNPQIVMNVFNFIKTYQTNMWKQFSDILLSFC